MTSSRCSQANCTRCRLWSTKDSSQMRNIGPRALLHRSPVSSSCCCWQNLRKRGKHKKEKYKFSQADHVNKISSALSVRSDCLQSTRKKGKIKNETVSDALDRQKKGSPRCRRLKCSDGFLMNRQIWYFCLYFEREMETSVNFQLDLWAALEVPPSSDCKFEFSHLV